MCSHYEIGVRTRKFLKSLQLNLPGIDRQHLYPAYQGIFVRASISTDEHDSAALPHEGVVGRWGLVAPWAISIGKYPTFNARSETASNKATFKNAWRKVQRCVIPADAIYEPDWRTSRHIPTRIAHVNDSVLPVAGLWERTLINGQLLYSYTMLTINADGHSIMGHLHREQDEKRMVVILPEDRINEWLFEPAVVTESFLTQYTATNLIATSEPR